jgi:hypothetical protein
MSTAYPLAAAIRGTYHTADRLAASAIERRVAGNYDVSPDESLVAFFPTDTNRDETN